MKPSVLIACCNGRGWVHKRVMFAAMNMIQDSRVETRFIAPTHSPFVQNLHRTVKDFLRGGEDFLLLMDDDNPPSAGNPLNLAFLDLDVVGLPTPVWNTSGPMGDRPWYFNALHEVKGEGWKPVDANGPPPGGLQEVDATGGGCVMIARRVLVELMERCKGNPMEAPFMRRWNDEGLVEAGNDYAFCQRARAAGFSIYVHWDYSCEHFNEVELTEVIERMSAANARPRKGT